MAIRIERYYDVGCSRCGQHRSTDYSHGMEYSAKNIRKYAHKEGWREINGETLCPRCMKETPNE